MNKNVKTRTELIENYLRDREYVTIKELASELNISTTTIQRDIIRMIGDGKVEKSHGYVMLPKNISFIPSFLSRSNIQTNKKNAIALKAATLLNEYDSIFIDAGSTCLALYEKIVTPNITIFTDNLMVAITDKNNYETYLLEGYIDKRNYSVYGNMTTENMDRINPDKLFFSCVGVNIDGKLLCFKEYDRAIINKIRMMKGEKILLLDSSKFGANGAFTIISLDYIDIIITDSDIPQEYKDMILKTGVKLIIV